MKLSPPNNTTLPELNGFMARSFWLQLLTVVAMILNSQGIDLIAHLCALEIGCTTEAVLATGDRLVSLWQQALPIVTGIWAYLERRAPHYRLVWPWKSGTLGGFLILLILLAFPPGMAQAQGLQCGPTDQVRQLLASKYGEVPTGNGLADGDAFVEVWANPETGTSTIITTNPAGQTGLIASGQDWADHPAIAALDGDPT